MADETTSLTVSFNNAHQFISIKLTPTNYLFWKTQITLFLEGQKLMGFVDGTYQRPSPMSPNYDHWVQQDKLIMSLLIASLSEDVFPMVIGLQTSHYIWITLEKAFVSKSDTSQLQLHTNLQIIKDCDQSVTHMDPSLYKAAQVGDLDVIRQNLDQLLVQLTPCKNTLLHVVAQFHDHAECVHEIILRQSSTAKQSMLTWKNSKDETALHIAARKGCLNIVRALIEQAKALEREDLESCAMIAEEMMRATDQNKDTALHVAVRNKHAEVVKLLVEEDPYYPHPLNKMEETPLYLAAESDRDDMVDSILTTCKSPTYRGPGGLTALHAAVLSNREGCTIKLLEHKQALTKEVDELGWTPLHYAARSNFVSRAAQLLEADRSAAYITADKDDNKTPLHVAACWGKLKVMKELLKHCPDCWEMTTSIGQNVLHLAVDHERKKVLDYILSNSWAANIINEKDAEGDTPLHLYATCNNLIGQRLVKYVGADKNAYNGKNSTPLDVIKNSETSTWREDAIKSELSRMGGHKGYRNIIQRDRDNFRVWKKKIAGRKKRLPDDIATVGETHLIVATLIATVTFAAGFTLPGGYDGNEGPNQGMAILSRKAAFKAFVVSDTIAVTSSTIAVFLHFVAKFVVRRTWISTIYSLAASLTVVAMVAMMVAFMTGLYTVLAPSLGLAITVLFFGSLSIVTCFLVFLSLILKILEI